MRYRAAAISPLRTARVSRRGEGDVNGARCSTLLAPIPLSSRRWNKKKPLYANSMGVACAIASHSSRALLFSPSPFFRFSFFSFPFSDRKLGLLCPPSISNCATRREIVCRGVVPTLGNNVVGLTSLALKPSSRKAEDTLLFKMWEEGGKTKTDAKSREERKRIRGSLIISNYLRFSCANVRVPRRISNLRANRLSFDMTRRSPFMSSEYWYSMSR